MAVIPIDKVAVHEGLEFLEILLKALHIFPHREQLVFVAREPNVRVFGVINTSGCRFREAKEEEEAESRLITVR